MAAQAAVKLRRQLTLFHGVAIICGLVMGSGIYVAPKAALQGTQSAGLSVVLWAVGGLMATLGALCFAELGTMFPSSGEKYHYLERMFGPPVGFLYLWMYTIFFRPGSNAIKCLTFAKYVIQPAFDCDPPKPAVILVSVALACVLVALNCWNVRWSAVGQSIFTSIGVCTLATIVVRGIVYIAMGNTEHLQNGFFQSSTDAGDIFLSLYSTIYSYWGWSALNFLVEELKDPYKNLPRAIWISMAIITSLYVSVNVSFLAVLGVEGVLQSEAVAVTFSRMVLSPLSWIMPICIAINTAASLNSAALVGSRLCFVGARRGHFPDVLALIHVKFLSPITALIFQLVITVVLVCTFDMYTLFNNLVFANNVFDALNVVGMLWLRYKRPDLPRPIKVYIIIPILFLVAMIVLVLVPLLTKTRETVIGFVLVLSSGAFYYAVFVLWRDKPQSYRAWVGKQTALIQKIFCCVKEDVEF